jgi:hypothetical protein
MVDHDALTAAVTEAETLDPAYAGPSDNTLLRPPAAGLARDALNRIVRGLLRHSNAAEFFGLLLPCGDGTAETFDLEMAAAWLVWEAKRRPASEVVDDFAHFLCHRELEGLKVELLHGLQMKTSIDLGSSLRLELFDNLPPSWQKNVFAKRRDLDHYGIERLGDPVALTLRFPISSGLVNRDDERTFQEHKRDDAERQRLLNVFPYLFTLLGDGAPVSWVSWSQITGRGVPSLGSPGYAMGLEDLGIMAFKRALQVSPTEVQRLSRQFLELPENSRTRLEVPLRHLNRSKRQYTTEAAAVDLRTALEALLVPDSGQEIAFKVGLFGAWMLGSDHAERQQAFKRLRDAYDVGSKAVHGSKIKRPNAGDLIERVQRDATAILRTFIAARDKINVLDIALGKPLNGASPS